MNFKTFEDAQNYIVANPYKKIKKIVIEFEEEKAKLPIFFKRPKNGLVTCNSCVYFNPNYDDGSGEKTPYCTECPTDNHPNWPLKKVSWCFNASAALDCPHYCKTNEDYVTKCQDASLKQWEDRYKHLGYKLTVIRKDKDFWKTDEGQRYLKNLGYL